MLEIISKAGRYNFKVVRDGKTICALDKRGWFQSLASTEVNGEKIKLKSTGVLQPKFDIFKNDRKCGRIAILWNGPIVISLNRSDGKGQDEFRLKRKSWMNRDYDLKSDDGKKLLDFKGKFSWSDWRVHYKIQEQNHPYPDEAINELLVYSAFALKMHIQQTSG